tara:strand:- start:1920 stop:2114 length:195 start_codon:yes stop_codon:yes gene_type:complete
MRRQADLPVLMGVKPGMDARSSRTADGLRGVGVGETDALGRQAIEVGSRDVGVAVAAEVGAVVF